MNLTELRTELADIPYQARVARMVELGRDPSNAVLLDAMERDDFEMRLLALHSCAGSRDGERTLRSLGDGSRLIRSAALGMVAQVCTEAQVVAALDHTAGKQRLRLMHHLLRHHRQSTVDACLLALAARNDRHLADWLFLGTLDLVQRYLPAFSDRLTDSQWSRLARYHPRLALELVRERAEATEQWDYTLRRRAQTALDLGSDSQPDAALALARVLTRTIPLSQLNLATLGRRRPAELAQLAIEVGALPHLDRPLWPKLQPELAVALYRLQGASRWLDLRAFRQLTPDARVLLFIAFSRGWEDRDGCLPPDLIALLPAARREAEGRIHLNRPALSAHPDRRLPYAAFLPWDEARQTLAPFLNNPDPELRALAHPILARAARYHRERLGQLLEYVEERGNEQDPIRNAMIGGLAALPPGIWQPEHLDTLNIILRRALDAADLSSATTASIEELLLRLLRRHSHWCAEWIATMARERGYFRPSDLQNQLTDDEVRGLAPLLSPVVQSWSNREGWERIYLLASALGPRLNAWPELADRIEALTRPNVISWLPEQCLSLLAKQCRHRAAVLIPQLVQEDPSWVTRPVVYTYLHRRRQDLLTPFLGFQAYEGRFATGKTRFVLPFSSGFYRWTSAQQQVFAGVLGEVTRDKDRDTPSILRVILQLAALPAVTPIRLIDLARADSDQAAAQEAALRALGRIDGGAGIPALLEAMDDHRSRIAIYALRSALLEMSPDHALAQLRTVPFQRVTVAKEVIRLIGELKTEAAYAELQRVDGLDLHRDARVALLRALWGYLDRDETWDLLYRTARADDPAMAAHLARIPADGLSSIDRQRVTRLLAMLLASRTLRVRLDTLVRCHTMPVEDDEQALLPGMVDALASPVAEMRRAAGLAIFRTCTAREADQIAEATRNLLPNRRALTALVEAAMDTLWLNPRAIRPMARAVLDALAADPLTVSLRISLAALILEEEPLRDYLLRLAESGEMHAGALLTAAQAMDRVRRQRPDVRIESLEEAFTRSEDGLMRRLGLAALLAQVSDTVGWTDARRSRLEAFRRDPSPLVAETAQFTFVPE